MTDFFRDYSRHYAHENRPPELAVLGSRPEVYTIRESWIPPDKHARVLDVGCGWGWLLARLWVSGYRNIQGVDLSEDMCAVARENLPKGIPILCADAFSYLGTVPAEFDLVTVFDLIEHMSAARGLELLKLCWRALKPQGSIVVRTGNMRNVLAANIRYTDVTHAISYNELSLLQLLDRAGFRSHRVVLPQYFCADLWRRCRSWRHPFRGLGLRDWLRYRANEALHRVLYRLSYPGFQAGRLTTFERFLTIQSWKSIANRDGD